MGREVTFPQVREVLYANRFIHRLWTRLWKDSLGRFSTPVDNSVDGEVAAIIPLGEAL